MSKKRLVPKRRFKGFTDDWEQRKFSDIAITRRGLTYKPSDIRENGIRVLRSSNIDEDVFVIGTDDVFVDKSAINIPFAEVGDILITSANGSLRLVGKHAIIYGSDNIPMVHGGFMLIASSTSPYFLNASMGSSWYARFINLFVAGGNGAIGNLNKKDLDDQIILVPANVEQQRIGSFFRNLDHLITLHQRKLEKAKSLKKSLLSEMFPAEGERKPKRRFPGFTGDWEQRKFSDIAITRRGLTYKPSDIRENGIRVLRSSNIDEDVFVIGTDDVFVDKSAINIPFAEVGDILITSANGSLRLVGKHAIIYGSDNIPMVHGGFMLIASSTSPYFLNASMGSSWYARFINLFVAGGNGAIGNLNKKDLDDQIILVPANVEQQRIGSFFRNLDHLITLHQRKLEKLQNLKKAYLNEMFI